MIAHTRKKNSSGFTLIEIMVALALSLILTAGVFQIYVSSKESFRVQGLLNGLQEDKRISVAMLQESIRLAGSNAPNTVVVAQSADGAIVDDEAQPDSITVQLTSPVDCLGADTTAAGGIATNTFSIQNNQLMCSGVAGVPQPLVSNVANMQILYGIDTVRNISDVPMADRYVPLGQVADPRRIVSIRIALLIETPDEFRTQAINQTFNLLDQQFVFQGTRVKRQVVTTTIPIRNALSPI